MLIFKIWLDSIKDLVLPKLKEHLKHTLPYLLVITFPWVIQEMVLWISIDKLLLSIWMAYYLCLHFSSLTQSCPTLCDPMNCSMPGLPVHHHLPEFTQTHVHQVRDAIHPLFAWSGQSTGASASVSFFPKKSQGRSPSEWTGWISLQSNRIHLLSSIK